MSKPETPPSIRRADQGDAVRAADIYEHYVRSTTVSFEVDPPDADEMARRIDGALAWYVIEQGDHVAGYAYAVPFASRAAYQWSAEVSVYLASDRAGRGFGGALLDCLLAELVRLGVVNTFAGIALPNERSVGLFESRGFRRVALYESVGHKLGLWLDVGWWQRQLREPTNPPPRRVIDRQALLRRLKDLVDSTSTRPLLVGIDGPGGAGKSTLARDIASTFDGAAIVQMDDIYLSAAQRMQVPKGVGTNYDRARLVAQVLEPLRGGGSARYQRYDWDTDALNDWIDVNHARIVLVEGVTSIADDIAAFYDLTVWVETPLDVCLQRGVARDGESARDQWEQVWLPGDDHYREVQRPDERADVIIRGS